MSETDKISSDSASLRMSTAQPRRLKQGPIIALVFAAIGIIIIAFAVAMLSEPDNVVVV